MMIYLSVSASDATSVFSLSNYILSYSCSCSVLFFWGGSVVLLALAEDFDFGRLPPSLPLVPLSIIDPPSLSKIATADDPSLHASFPLAISYKRTFDASTATTMLYLSSGLK